MGRRHWAFAALAVALLPGRSAAQQRGTFEASAFVRGTLFDPSIKSPQGGVGVGARFGAYLRPQWLVEADASTSSSSGLDYQPVRVRLDFLDEYKTGGKMVLGVGYVFAHYAGTLDGSDSGLTGLFGLRQTFGASAFGRVEFAVDFLPSPTNGAGNNFHGSLQLVGGYSFGAR